MDITNCPWPASTQIPPHYCEPNLCAWIVQPINTWTNLAYLVAAIVILRQKNWNSDKYWLSLLSTLLFIGSWLFHMTGTYWGRDLDVGAMLLLSGFAVSLTLTRYLNLNRKYLFILTPIISASSIVNIHSGWGGRIFVIQVVTTILAEWAYAHKHKIPQHLKMSLIQSLLIFIFALTINLIDMNQIYCLPQNNFVTLHGIWHILCGYCIYLASKYFCSKYSIEKIS